MVENDGVHGEMYIKGPCMMMGYLDNPSATAATIDQEGWLRTEDVAYRRNGKLYIIDRAKVRRPFQVLSPVQCHCEVWAALLCLLDHMQSKCKRPKHSAKVIIRQAKTTMSPIRLDSLDIP